MFAVSLLTVLVLSVASGCRVVVLFGPDAPSLFKQELITSLEALLFEFPYRVEGQELSEFLNSDEKPPTVIADFTDTPSYALGKYITQHQVVWVLPTHNPMTNLKHLNFYLHPHADYEVEAIEALLQSLEWELVHFTFSQEAIDQALYLEDLRPYGMVTTEMLSSTVDQQVYTSYASRMVKTSANWKVVSIGNGQHGQKLAQGFVEARINRERGALLLGSSAAWVKYELGTLVVVEEGLQEAESHGEAEALAIYKLLSVTDLSQCVHNTEFRDRLEEGLPNHSPEGRFLVVNYKESWVRTVIGSIEDGVVDLTETPVFLGNVTEIPSTLPPLPLSANTAEFEYTGDPNFSNSMFIAGLAPMIEILNADDSLVPNFQLTLHGTDCGVLLFDYDYFKECFTHHAPHLGLLYLETYGDNVAAGTIQILRETDIHIPHTGFFMSLEELTSKETTPELMITTAPQTAMGIVLALIVKSFGWEKVNVIYVEGNDEERFGYFALTAETLNIEIVNRLKTVPKGYVPDDFEQYRSVFEDVKNTKCRIVVIIASPPEHVYIGQGLYDVGLRNGEVMIIASLNIANYVDNDGYAHDREKVMEMFDGSISLSESKFETEYGIAIEQQIAEMISPTSTGRASYMIDSLLLGVHALDMMLWLGEDIEDPERLNYFMRVQ